MRRLVRDISARKNNQVELKIVGGETEVDRSVIEHISDPLVHILRNSIDHGIEMPEDREKHGKDPVGRIQLAARRVGGEIWIVIEDDGGGLNKEQILNTARKRGLVLDNTVDLSDQKIYEMIFQPGFSTATQVTHMSGRGVGMDVVSRNIEKIRGRVDVQSQEGKGTSIFLKIPLTTAIVDGMLIRINDSIYAIPTLDIKESLQVNDMHVTDLMDGQEIIKVRDQLIPVLRLQELHDLGGANKALEEGIVVVTETSGNGVGFLVDEIIGQQQLVIKALPEYIGKLDGVSGCAVLGNGDICLILDLPSLVKIAESCQENAYMLEEV
jgi:two-component system chemotaxis sensor kinase CheA